jgi:hypothetical protein
MQIQRQSRPPAIEFGLYLINVLNSKFARQANSCLAPPRNPIDSERQWILGSDTDRRCKGNAKGIRFRTSDLRIAPS